MDSMVEIFYEESNALINELRAELLKYKECESYDEGFIKNVFRGIHTLKADSTMMLFDTISSLSRSFESLLYFFRNKKLPIKDKNRFENLLSDYIDFVKEEVDKLPIGEKLYTGETEIDKEIKKYIDELNAECKVSGDCEDKEECKNDSEEQSSGHPKKKRQVYYIASAASDDNVADSSDNKSKSGKKNYDESVVIVKQGDIDRIYSGVKHYNDFISKLEKKFVGDETIELTRTDFIMFKDIGKSVFSAVEHLTKSDFVAISKKMEMIVDEMSASLCKPVKLLVSGEQTLVDKMKCEKISSALTHVIRNSVDHGIEDIEIRESMGKPPIGLVRLIFSDKDGHLEIVVEDDGAGIDKKAVIESAAKNNMLKKSPEQYTDDEVFDLLLMNGVSTTEKPNDYSGRGVGMDVINHNVLALGGKLKITSKEGYGTKIIMMFE